MNIKLKNVRLGSKPNLFVPEPYNKNKPTENLSYNARILIKKDDAASMKIVNDAIVETMKAEFGDKAKAMLTKFRDDKKQFFIKDGDTYLNTKGDPTCPGYYVIGARRRVDDGKPGVYDNKPGADGKPAVLTSLGRIYGGCMVNAKLDIWVQNTPDHQGVRCALLGVQYAGEGQAFGGSRPASAEDFEAVASVEEAATATDDNFDDIAF